MAGLSPEGIRDDAALQDRLEPNSPSRVPRSSVLFWKGDRLRGERRWLGLTFIEAFADAGYKGVRDMLPPELHPVYDRSAGERLFARNRRNARVWNCPERGRAGPPGRASSSNRTLADEAVRQVEHPDMFDRYVATGTVI